VLEKGAHGGEAAAVDGVHLDASVVVGGRLIALGKAAVGKRGALGGAPTGRPPSPWPRYLGPAPGSLIH
jgi:hypothetical protein